MTLERVRFPRPRPAPPADEGAVTQPGTAVADLAGPLASAAPEPQRPRYIHATPFIPPRAEWSGPFGVAGFVLVTVLVAAIGFGMWVAFEGHVHE